MLSGSLTTTNYTASQLISTRGFEQAIAVTVKSGESITAGDALAKETSSGKYRAYDTDGAGGLETAMGIAAFDVDASAGDVVTAMFTRGNLHTSKLGANFDADALGQLNGRQVEGETIF